MKVPGLKSVLINGTGNHLLDISSSLSACRKKIVSFIFAGLEIINANCKYDKNRTQNINSSII